ncbi:hypothetical protein [Parafrankia colletiae]|uniref:hypothetical protein n=1 Tax=Parafrankia colletiae TaxID=573497 RepID=UPI0038993117
MSTLAARAEVSESTARRAVRALEMAGVLATERGGGRRSNRYRLVRPPAPASTASLESGPEAPVEDRAARFSEPMTPQESTSRPPGGRTRRPRWPAAASRRGRTVPEDLRPLADALVARGLRASYALTAGQADRVRAVLGRAGVGAMVAAAYRAHRAADPARWWSAWLEIWSGLHTSHTPPAPVSSAPAQAPMVGDAAAGAAACRAALVSARRFPAQGDPERLRPAGPARSLLRRGTDSGTAAGDAPSARIVRLRSDCPHCRPDTAQIGPTLSTRQGDSGLCMGEEGPWTMRSTTISRRTSPSGCPACFGSPTC